MNRREVNKFLESGAEKIDITPSMHKEAVKHYNAIGNFLEDSGISANVIPCGSMVTGTPTRPLSDDEDSYFDIDILVERTDLEKGSCTPADVRKPVETLFRQSDRYAEKMESCDECITIRYVLNGKEGGFRLDLDTCVGDSTCTEAPRAPESQKHTELSVAIARNTTSEWLGSNPRGLCMWFLEKNERLAASGRQSRKEELAKRHADVYASLDDVPDMMDRSPLQRAVQIAKRSRDEYYRRADSNRVPASCVLTVLFGILSDIIPDGTDTLDILTIFINAAAREQEKAAMGRKCLLGYEGNWNLENPVYPENMLDGWTDADADRFFLWADDLKRCIYDLTAGGARGEAGKEAIFGKKVVRSLAAFSPAAASSPHHVVPKKPWRTI